MGRFIAGAMVLGVLLAGCGGGKSEALKEYKRFSAAQRKGDCNALRDMAVDKALEDVEKFCAPAGTFMGKKMPSAASMASDMAGTPRGAMSGWRIEVESFDKSGDEVTMDVVRKPSGRGARKSAFNTPAPPQHKTVKMSKASGSWKVSEVFKK